MKTFIVIASCLLLSCSASIVLKSSWAEYKLKHGKVYENSETEEYRYKLWLETSKWIEEHNRRYDAGEVSYYLGHNHMSDMTEAERNILLGKGLRPERKARNNRAPKLSDKPVPESFDWREKGAVNAIKNQGKCQSCWAFSAVASLEGQYFLKTKQLLSFSEQQLVDCMPHTNCSTGGWMDTAFDFLKTHGLETEQSYPYLGYTHDCKYDTGLVALAEVKDFADLPSGDEDALKRAIAEVGPISVAIDASLLDFSFYSGGVYSNPACSSDHLDHGVNVVGYGVIEDGQDYFILRNSWGEVWGENGYARMARNMGNMCGIATAASYPIL